MNNKWVLLFLLFTLPVSVPAERVTTLSRLVNPHKLIVSADRVIVEDFPRVYIYSAKDYKLRFFFGKEGEGPGEYFPRSGYRRLNITVREDFIFVESRGRLSFFNGDGAFLREINSAAAGYLFQPLGKDTYIALKDVGGSGGVLYKTVNLYEPDLKIRKEIFRTKHGSQEGKSIVMFDGALRYFVCGGYIYIVNDFDFLVRVFDRSGNFVRTIRREDYRFLEITEAHKKRTREYLKRHLPNYPQIRHRLKFPAGFPAVRQIECDNREIYITTFRRKGAPSGGVECFIFDLEGTFLRRVFLPLVEESVIREYPYDIYNGKVYQLIENEETEHWDLHISDIPE